MHGQRREHDAENAGDDIGAGLTQHLHNTRGKKQRYQRDQQNKKRHGQHDCHDPPISVMPAHHQQDRRQGPRAGDERNGERKNGDVLLVLRLLLLAVGGGAQLCQPV